MEIGSYLREEKADMLHYSHALLDLRYPPGNRLEVDIAGQVFEIPPKSLIKPDSSIRKEEDFSNHVEEFYSWPETYAKRYPKIHQFLKGRLKK